MVHICVALLSLVAAPQTGPAWLRWGGPGGDFRVDGEAIGWSGQAPRRAWQRDLGDGFSAVVGDGTRIFTAYRRGGDMVVTAIDAGTGQPAWEHAVETPPLASMFLDYGQGPNATPVVANDTLFITGFTGRLLALDAATGKRRWQRELWSELRGTFRDVGYSNTALLYRDLVIVPVGGRGKALAAFRQSDGSTVWMSGDYENAMSTPILIDVDGQPQVVAFMVEGVAGFDPSAGTLLWFHAHRTQYAVNSSTPVWHAASKTIVVSSAYDQGARAIRLRRDGSRTIASEAWFNRRLRVHHGNMLVLGGHVYGSNGDFGPAPLTAVDVTTGTVAWQSRTFPKVNLVQAGDRTIVLDEDGRLAVAVLSPTGLQVLQEAQVTTKLSWTVPTLIGRRLYVRDRRTLIALDLERVAARS
jgi:outer membrane protein assembly factor BamB